MPTITMKNENIVLKIGDKEYSLNNCLINIDRPAQLMGYSVIPNDLSFITIQSSEPITYTEYQENSKPVKTNPIKTKPVKPIYDRFEILDL